MIPAYLIYSLNATNGDLIKQIGDFTDLTIKGAENLEKSLESMKEMKQNLRLIL